MAGPFLKSDQAAVFHCARAGGGGLREQSMAELIVVNPKGRQTEMDRAWDCLFFFISVFQLTRHHPHMAWLRPSLLWGL